MAHPPLTKALLFVHFAIVNNTFYYYQINYILSKSTHVVKTLH